MFLLSLAFCQRYALCSLLFSFYNWILSVWIKSTSPRLLRSPWSTERFEVKAKERLVNDLGLMLLAQLSWSQKDVNAGGACCQQKYVNFLLVWKGSFKSASLFTGFYDGRDWKKVADYDVLQGFFFPVYIYKALAKLSNKVGFNVPTLLEPTLSDRLAAHVGWCLSNNFCSIKCWIEVAFGQTFRPTILVDEKMLECFAALPTKLYPQAGHVRPPSHSWIKA